MGVLGCRTDSISPPILLAGTPFHGAQCGGVGAKSIVAKPTVPRRSGPECQPAAKSGMAFGALNPNHPITGSMVY